MPKTISVAVPEACTLCPRQCKADRAAGQTGFCGAGRTLKAARAALHVMTPCIGTVNLYKTSGHWDHYRENMFPAMEMEGESYVLRPMNCPHRYSAAQRYDFIRGYTP